MPNPTIVAVRGAIQVPVNRAEAIRGATTRLLKAMMERNRLETRQVISAVFTATPDLDADFPAHAARELGWQEVPLLGAVEMAVPGAPARIVRVLLTVAREAADPRLEPIYLEGAAALRPDLASGAAVEGKSATGGTLPRTLALIGLGQIGGSIGLALAGRREWRRVGFDVDPEVMARALAAGAVDAVAGSLEEVCRDAAVAVIATPVDVIPECVRLAASALPEGAVLLDTGSARAGITPALAEAAVRGVRAVGGHPLAGNEGHGLESARAALFEGTRFVLCPPPAGVPKEVEELIEAIGATPLITTPEEHDAALGRTSHLPYLLARALRVAGADAETRGLFGPAFRDMTRVAASDARVAEAYCRANFAEIAAGWRALQAEMDGLMARLSRS